MGLVSRIRIHVGFVLPLGLGSLPVWELELPAKQRLVLATGKLESVGSCAKIHQSTNRISSSGSPRRRSWSRPTHSWEYCGRRCNTASRHSYAAWSASTRDGRGRAWRAAGSYEPRKAFHAAGAWLAGIQQLRTRQPNWAGRGCGEQSTGNWSLASTSFCSCSVDTGGSCTLSSFSSGPAGRRRQGLAGRINSRAKYACLPGTQC